MILTNGRACKINLSSSEALVGFSEAHGHLTSYLSSSGAVTPQGLFTAQLQVAHVGAHSHLAPSHFSAAHPQVPQCHNASREQCTHGASLWSGEYLEFPPDKDIPSRCLQKEREHYIPTLSKQRT